ncbi:MAG: DNA-binding protein [Dehalococcoidia bacterium]|nr:MAG: DNA-binding protein [Dehalococcoidia bacterium]
MSDKLLTLKEAAECLHITEKQVRRLVSEDKIPAYQIGGMYLRFKEENIFLLRAKFGGKPMHENIERHGKASDSKNSLVSGVRDFLYFNDFYIIAAVLIIFLIYIILKVIR